MLHSFTFPQDIIDSIQERIKVLERCLNDANLQDEAMAEILELANTRQISISQLADTVMELQYKINKFIKFAEVLKVKEHQNELSLILFVRYHFLFKQILDQYWDFMFINQGKKIFSKLIKLSLILDENKLQKNITNEDNYACYSNEEKYILAETNKHLIKSLIEVSLRINILTQEEINAFNLGDITPQESEAMLISLASTKKWDYVYRKLA